MIPMLHLIQTKLKYVRYNCIGNYFQIKNLPNNWPISENFDVRVFERCNRRTHLSKTYS